MTQVHVLSDPVALYSWRFCLISVAHLPVSHVTTLRCGSFHLQAVVTKHSKFSFLHSGLRPEKNLTKQQN